MVVATSVKPKKVKKRPDYNRWHLHSDAGVSVVCVYVTERGRGSTGAEPSPSSANDPASAAQLSA